MILIPVTLKQGQGHQTRYELVIKPPKENVHPKQGYNQAQNPTGSSKVIFCFCIVRGFEGEDALENFHFLLFCLIK